MQQNLGFNRSFRMSDMIPESILENIRNEILDENQDSAIVREYREDNHERPCQQFIHANSKSPRANAAQPVTRNEAGKF